MPSLEITEPWMFEPLEPAFKPHVRCSQATDEMEALFLDESYYRKVINEEVEILTGTSSLKTVGVCLKNARERLRNIPAQDPLLLGAILAVYEMPASVRDLLLAQGGDIPTPYFICDSCKKWELYRFESTNTCDLCSLAEVVDIDIPLTWV